MTFTNEFRPDIQIVCTDGPLNTHKLCLEFLSDYFTVCLTTTMYIRPAITIEYPRHVVLYIMNVLFYKDKPQISCADYHLVIACADLLCIKNIDLAMHMVYELGCDCDKDHEELKNLFVMYPQAVRFSKGKFADKIFRITEPAGLIPIVEQDACEIRNLTSKQCYGMYRLGFRGTTEEQTISLMYAIMKFLDPNEIYELLSHIDVRYLRKGYYFTDFVDTVLSELKNRSVPQSDIVKVRFAIGFPEKIQAFINERS